MPPADALPKRWLGYSRRWHAGSLHAGHRGCHDYNRGNLYALRQDYNHAIEDYTRAISLEERLAEAWFNRGLALIYAKREAEGIADLSKAGELGIYQAYSIIKQKREK